MNQRILVILGKCGDVLSVLPIAWDYAQKGERIALMVSRQFSDILDGVSYVDKIVFDGDSWQIDKAVAQARQLSGNVTCLQVAGPPELVKEYSFVPSGQEKATTDSYQKESWRLAGKLGLWRHQPPLIFDQRNPEREKKLMPVGWFNRGKKKQVMLVSTGGETSPFPFKDLLMELLSLRFPKFNLIDLSAIRAERIYDLLGLYEIAQCLIATDSAPLHLAHACPKLPVLALVNDKPSMWHGSLWRPQHIFYCRYSDWPKRAIEMIDRIESIREPESYFYEARKTPSIVHIWNDYEPSSAVHRHTWKREYRLAHWIDFHSELGVFGRDGKSVHKLEPRAPFIKDMIWAASMRAKDNDLLCLTRSDIGFEFGLTDQLLTNAPCWAHRSIIEGDKRTFNPAVDLVAFNKDFWVKFSKELPDFVYGPDSQWTTVFVEWLKLHGGKELKFAVFRSNVPLKPKRPSSTHNEKLAVEWLEKRGIAPAQPTMFDRPQEIIKTIKPNGSSDKLIVRRTGALGDALAATVVADKLIEMGRQVVFQSDPACHCILRRCTKLSAVEEPHGLCHVNLDGAYESRSDRATAHFSKIFIEAANQQLKPFGIEIPNAWNATPKLTRDFLPPNPYRFNNAGRPWVLICPRSNSHLNRTVPDEIWSEVAKAVNAPCFWIGTNPAPPGMTDCELRHLDSVIDCIQCADLLVTVDTGPMHIAAALGVPVVAIEQASSPRVHLTDQRDFITVSPPLDCLNCQQVHCPIDPNKPPCQDVSPDLIAAAVNRRLRSLISEDISAVIACYKPDIKRLQKCIDHVIDQVQEVVIAVDGDGILPYGINKHDKIRYALNKSGHRLGYGKNANLGARHSNGKYILLLNDDVYLSPNAVAKMREVMDEKTGLVAQLLYYPDGTIQHGGSYREPGGLGWGHVDHNKREPSITEPCEMENVTMASALVRRKAFYEVLGFDERYDCYCEDTDLCMKLRQAGWKIMYQPKATGIHEEHQTTIKVIEGRVLQESQRSFADKWAPYFVHNAHRIPGNFEFLKA